MSRKSGTKNGLRARVGRVAAVATAALACLGIGATGASAIELSAVEMGYTQPESTSPLKQAGGHPDITTTFASKEDSPGVIKELMHQFELDLVPGLLANSAKFPTCPAAMMKAGPSGNSAVCPIESQIGGVEIPGLIPMPFPLYNVVAPKGAPALYASNILGTVVVVKPTVRPGPQGYAVTMDSGTISQALPFSKVVVKFWGVPAESVHDLFRMRYVDGSPTLFNPSPDVADPKVMTLAPTSCTTEPVFATGRLDGWQTIGQFDEQVVSKDPGGEDIKFDGCEQLKFSPTVEAKPTTTVADSPTGLDVKITIPQNEDPDGLAESHLKDVTMTLPAGMTVNPSSANGLGACSPTQIGLVSPVGDGFARFDAAKANCPDSSKLGTIRVDTALLANPMPGEVYLAQPRQNPFGSLLALYIVIDDPQSGTRIKLAGEVKPDPKTGQLEVITPNNPQLPFEEFRVNLFTGPRAALKTPVSCGTHTTTSMLVPWASPYIPPVAGSNSYTIDKGPAGACASSDAAAPNNPTFSAGTVDPAAGTYTPFVLKLNRADGSQRINRIRATLPKGLLGKLAGTPYCSDAALTVAAGKAGKAEQAAPSCPAASEVGSVDVAAGAGSNPFHAAGKAYLAGPYKGAPLSLAVVVPAVAGPFDLGTVVVRNALNVDPATTEITAVSDEFPTILQGIPLDIRSVDLRLAKPSFTLNPTSCDPMAITGAATSPLGVEAALTSPFQVGGCGALGFKPKLSLKLTGGTTRAKYPALTAELSARPGDTNIGRASVAMPRTEMLAQNHIRTICTRVQWAADACPPQSRYGDATAWSPLLDQPLSGPVYLRASSNKLPDLVADLRGQIRVELVGRIDSVRGGIRTTFESVPDAPVSKFVLKMQGGKKGLLVNSRNVCQSTSRATVQLDGQNGKVSDSRPALVHSGCKKQNKRSGR
ncbi:MAG TPA: hypothetical protein VEW07_10170 [Solirubrobacterales bacterium]|nr:hypothetical protein [Solirubrobacterales bacterium]